LKQAWTGFQGGPQREWHEQQVASRGGELQVSHDPLGASAVRERGNAESQTVQPLLLKHDSHLTPDGYHCPSFNSFHFPCILLLTELQTQHAHNSGSSHMSCFQVAQCDLVTNLMTA
jgi:hypothetical protein